DGGIPDIGDLEVVVPVDRTLLVEIHDLAANAVRFEHVAPGHGVPLGSGGFAIGVETFLEQYFLGHESTGEAHGNACCEQGITMMGGDRRSTCGGTECLSASA